MPMRIGLLAYPALLLILVLTRSGPVRKFAKARAFSAETARRPGSIGIVHVDEVRDAVRRGSLIATEDGRFFVNMERYLRLRRRIIIVMVAGSIVTAAVAAWMFWS